MQSFDHDNDRDSAFFPGIGRGRSSTIVQIQGYALSSGDERWRARVALRRIHADSTYAKTRCMDGDSL